MTFSEFVAPLSVQPVFVHCHECQIRVSPSGRRVLDGKVAYASTPEGIERLHIAALSQKGALYLTPPGVL